MVKATHRRRKFSVQEASRKDSRLSTVAYIFEVVGFIAAVTFLVYAASNDSSFWTKDKAIFVFSAIIAPMFIGGVSYSCRTADMEKTFLAIPITTFVVMMVGILLAT